MRGGSVVAADVSVTYDDEGDKASTPAQINQAWLLAHKPWIVPNMALRISRA